MLGGRISSLRTKAGLSQNELASRLNISPSAVGMYEQGRREPSINILIALSKEFHVSIDYLLTGHTGLGTAVSSTKKSALDPRTLSRNDLAVLIAALLIDGE